MSEIISSRLEAARTACRRKSFRVLYPSREKPRCPRNTRAKALITELPRSMRKRSLMKVRNVTGKVTWRVQYPDPQQRNNHMSAFSDSKGQFYEALKDP
jgi:hypothetical protein